MGSRTLGAERSLIATRSTAVPPATPGLADVSPVPEWPLPAPLVRLIDANLSGRVDALARDTIATPDPLANLAKSGVIWREWRLLVTGIHRGPALGALHGAHFLL